MPSTDSPPNASYVHTGLTVQSLAKATHLFSDLLGLHVQRTGHLTPPLSTVVGHAQAEVHTALLDLGSGHQLELLEYASPQFEGETSAVPLPWVPNSFHFCFIVDDLDATIQKLRNATWQGESMGWKTVAEPQTLLAGPNKGKKVCYLRDSEGLVLEFFGRA